MEPQNTIPFEDTSQPFFQRLIKTAGMAFTQPFQLFEGTSRGDIGLPLIYGVIVGTVAGVLGTLWSMLFGTFAMLAEGVGAGEFVVGTGMYLFILFLMPLLVVVGMFISTVINHLCLMILGDGKRGFAVTFRAVAYGNTPALLCILPFCGGFIGGIWAMIVQIIGFKAGHKSEWWQAILAYFLPTICCCCLIIYLLMTFGVLGAIFGR
jgi:hypothetical protein